MGTNTSPEVGSLEATATATRISQRQSKACRECTRRKIRCDKRNPCGRCVRLSKTCSREVVRISKADTIHRDELEFLTQLCEHLESSRDTDEVLATLQQRMALLTYGPDHQALSPADAIETPSEKLDHGTTGSRPLTSSHPQEPLPATVVASGSHTSSKSDGSHASNFQRVEFLAWGRHGGNCFPHANCPCRGVRAYAEVASINADLGWPGLRRTLAVFPPHIPLLPATEARKLVQFHMENILWHHNVFHAPTFLAQCEEFWLAGTVVHPLWLPLYLAVILVSAWTALNSGSLWCGAAPNPSLPLTLFQAMVQTLYQENFCENLSIFSIQAIVLSTRVAHNLDQSNLNATLVGAAIRIAHNMGLHKIEGDDSKTRTESPEARFRTVETEVGRRCWNQLIIQDYFQIPFTGTYIIHPWHYTTDLPVNCHDEDMVARQEEEPTINSYPRTLSRIAVLMPRLLDGLGPATAPFTLTDVARHVASSDQALRHVMRGIPSFLQASQPEDMPNSLAWLPAARHSLALSAADKIIMIHRPVLYHSFQMPALARTRAICVAAAMTIFRAYECISEEVVVPIWTHSAFCVTAAMVIGLELLFCDSHMDDKTRRLRAAMTTTSQRLRRRKNDIMAERGAALIDTVLRVEEDLVLKVMRLSHPDGPSLKSAQRDIANSMIGENEIMAKFLALSPVVDSNFRFDGESSYAEDVISDDAPDWFSDDGPGLFTSFNMLDPYLYGAN